MFRQRASGLRARPLRGPGRSFLLASLIGIAGFAAVQSPAEILYLKEGGSIEGEVLEIGENGYRVRTIRGTLLLPFESVMRREESSPVVTEYDRRVRELEQTAAGHFALAQWCEQQGITAEAGKHVQRALELNPDYEPARAATGYVRVGPLWVEALTVVQDAPPTEEPAPGGEAPKTDKPAKKKKPQPEPEELEEEKLVAAIQNQYTRQLRAIRNAYLDSPQENAIAEGRKRVLEIQDPLVVLPLVKTMSDGSLPCREVLVEMLTRFPQDEATLNLAALALADRDAEVRRTALKALLTRDDPRVPVQFREALRSGNEALVRRAAFALGVMKSNAAIPNLIDSLTTRARKRIEEPVGRYFNSMGETFNRPTSLTIGRRVNVNHRPVLGVATAGNFLFRETELQKQDVTVYRTEVLEALVAITGVNHGFDAAVWRRWYEEHKP